MMHLLTYSMVHSPSWEANWFAASQEIPHVSRNPKVHYRTHKRPPPVSNLGQPNPVHIPTSRLLEIHPNIIHPSTPWSPQWSPTLRFPHQDPIHTLSSPIRATCPAHLINDARSHKYQKLRGTFWILQSDLKFLFNLHYFCFVTSPEVSVWWLGKRTVSLQSMQVVKGDQNKYPVPGGTGGPPYPGGYKYGGLALQVGGWVTGLQPGTVKKANC